jgi:hypothetical protein
MLGPVEARHAGAWLARMARMSHEPTWDDVAQQRHKLETYAANPALDHSTKLSTINKEAAILEALVCEVSSANAMQSAHLLADALDRSTAAAMESSRHTLELAAQMRKWTLYAAITAAVLVLLAVIEFLRLLGYVVPRQP